MILLGGVLALFGAKGVPEVAKRLGSGVREVKDAVADVDIPRRMLDSGEDRRPRQPKAEPPDEA